MPLKVDTNTSATAHHIKDGAVVFPYAIDAHSAVSRFPDEWSFTPWGKQGEKTVPIAEIPSDWQDSRPLERIALAVKLGAERKGLTAAKADEVIEAEVERRAAEPVEEPEPRLTAEQKARADKISAEQKAKNNPATERIE